MFRTLLFLCSIFILSGCTTPYGDMGFTGGVEATQIDDRTIRVHARGNAYTSSAIIQDYVLLKAAEETLRLGFDLFTVIDSESYSKTGAFTTPGTAHTTGHAYSTGNYAYGSATTTYYPGQTFYYSKPRSDIVVQMFEGEMPENAPANLFDAQTVYKYLGAKYIKESETDLASDEYKE